MAMNNNCNCGYNPCQCHTSCRPPVTCIPSPPSNRPKPPTITVDGLLKLINTKCDKETCAIFQVELDILWYLLGLEEHRPSKPGIPGHKPPVIVPPGTKPPVVTPPLPGLPAKGLQLVANMTHSLKGDLKDKYPSAILLKEQLQSLWQCMYNRQSHHGEWKDNFTLRVVTPTTEECLLDGNKDHAPKTIKVISPIDVGSTVYHMVGKKKCLFMSLIDDNISEPSKLTVLEGKWFSYCGAQEAIDCTLPRKIITDCKEHCDDPNKDGVKEEKTMCARMEAVEAYMKSHP